MRDAMMRRDKRCGWNTRPSAISDTETSASAAPGLNRASSASLPRVLAPVTTTSSPPARAHGPPARTTGPDTFCRKSMCVATTLPPENSTTAPARLAAVEGMRIEPVSPAGTLVATTIGAPFAAPKVTRTDEEVVPTFATWR
ncbi:MAG: hypothetical protein E6G46_00445 [Actinobacteria bacterium]|nr:MAG: hypothetical protein E6G46_00445 [Actinomycetota bacterium]